MKIAVCYSGEARDIHATYPNHVTNVYQHHDVDVFLHTWECTAPSVTLPFQERGQWHTQIRVAPTAEYLSVFKPKRSLVEIRTDSAAQDHRTRRVAMFYGIAKSVGLIEDPAAYDLIVRIRSDAYFQSPIPFETLTDPETVYIPALPPGFNVGWQPGDWDPEVYCPDFVACGSPAAMQAYVSFATSSECATDEACVEWSLCSYLKAYPVQIAKLPTVCGLYRFRT
jgi:hypothetical protein